jgi:hypothetical protein
MEMHKTQVLKKVLIGLFLVLMIMSPLSAAVYTSVPVDHWVYRLLDAAEIRGLISRQVATRPYSADKIMKLLVQIQGQKESISAAEDQKITDLLSEFTLTYGKEEHGFDEVLSNGFVRTYDENLNMGASMGVEISTSQGLLLGTDSYDSRNSVLAFLKGDLGNSVSFNMNFGVSVDHLDPAVYLPTEFTIPCEGYYRSVTDGFGKVTSLPSPGFYEGTQMFPELSASYLDGAVNLRWGSINRDWGPGLNNLQISSTARTFDGIEAEVDISSWMRYSVMTGSLGIFTLDTLDGEDFFSDNMFDKENFRFNNNLSAHRVEVDVTPNLTLALWESVVWEKRFEIGYLNPLTIYMFEQNNLGDLDDMIAGFDANYTLPGKARLYGAMGLSEFHDIGSLKTMLTAPRNIMALQAGVVIPLKIGSFSSLTFQWTYIAPFFYSHYPTMEEVATIDSVDSTTDITDTTTTDRDNTFTVGNDPSISSEEYVTLDNDDGIEYLTFDDDDTAYSSDGRIKVVDEGDGTYTIYETSAESAYVNKGEAIGYPLNPNSQEFLLQLDMAFENGWTTCSTVKYQVRSGQYGYEIEQYMFYSDYEDYEDKDFWGNTFEHAITLQQEVSKKLPSTPIELNVTYRFTTTWAREIYNAEPDGRNDGFGPWQSPEFENALTVGATIFF